MTLKDWRAEIDYFTGELSSLIRKLCFLGIAILWIFKGDMPTQNISSCWKYSLLFFILTFGVDIVFLAYSANSASTTFNEKEKELNKGADKKRKNIEDQDTGGWSNTHVKIKVGLRYCKLILLVVGYVLAGFVFFND